METGLQDQNPGKDFIYGNSSSEDESEPSSNRTARESQSNLRLRSKSSDSSGEYWSLLEGLEPNVFSEEAFQKKRSCQ